MALKKPVGLFYRRLNLISSLYTYNTNFPDVL